MLLAQIQVLSFAGHSPITYHSDSYHGSRDAPLIKALQNPLLPSAVKQRMVETDAMAETVVCEGRSTSHYTCAWSPGTRCRLQSGLPNGTASCGRANRWWGIMGNSGQADGEVALLHAAASREGVRTVCEVGFNAGHAATAMLHGLQTRLVEFDLLSLPYSQHARAAIEQRYPGRASFHEGRSQLTIPEYAAKVAADATAHPPCDLWMVDGDHWKGALLDMRAAVNSSRDGALIVADDCSSRHPLVIAAWKSVVSAGHVVELFKGGTRQGGNVGVKGWCVGRVVRKAGDAARLSSGFEHAGELRIDPVSRALWTGKEKLAREQ